jgi:hypothetical protein
MPLTNAPDPAPKAAVVPAAVPAAAALVAIRANIGKAMGYLTPSINFVNRIILKR